MILPADQRPLATLAAAGPDLVARTITWCEVNSGSFHLAGLARMADLLAQACQPLGGLPERLPTRPYRETSLEGQLIEKPLGQVLRLRVRPEAPRQVLLNGHYDTVYEANDPFQTCDHPRAGVLRGPGVADMKGGLVVLFAALAAFEQSPERDRLGWELLLVPDEEIGTVGSVDLVRETASRHRLGLIVEPSPPEGDFVRARMGGGAFTIAARGRAAHSGRDFAFGRNAITGLAAFLVPFAERANQLPGVIANVGHIAGGGAINIVPDQARAVINLRVDSPAAAASVEALVAELLAAPRPDALHLSWQGSFNRPPKPVTPASRALLDFIQLTAAALGQPTGERDTGGGSDGNLMQDAGLPVIDTLGVLGGALHSAEEFALESSFSERAQLLYLLLARLARGEAPAAALRG